MAKKEFNPFYDSDFLISREGSDDRRMLVELYEDELIQLRTEIDEVLKNFGKNKDAHSNHKSEMDFFILMKAAYIRYADSYAAKVDISKGGPGEFALDIYALGTEKYPGLLKFMRDHNIEPNDNEFNECFYNVKKEYESIKDRLAQSFNLNATVIDDDGFKGKVVAYNPEANMYKIEHELVNGRLPVADGWYPPERLQLAVENTKSALQLSNAGGLDSLIATARAISEQSKSLADNLGKFKGESGIDKE